MLYLILAGLLVFVIGVWVSGLWLRKHSTKLNAEKSSRIVHFLFLAGFGTPALIAIFYPGLIHLDALVGLNPLPMETFFLITGILIALPGIYLLAITNKLLRSLGSGANAFQLTKTIVETDIYQRTRNPMSLGYYLFALGFAFISGSTFLTLAILIGLIPAHLFFLKYFEEYELELRFGESYRQYQQEVPFLFPILFAEKSQK